MPIDLLLGAPLFSCPGDPIAYFDKGTGLVLSTNKSYGVLEFRNFPHDFITMECLKSMQSNYFTKTSLS